MTKELGNEPAYKVYDFEQTIFETIFHVDDKPLVSKETTVVVHIAQSCIF